METMLTLGYAVLEDFSPPAEVAAMRTRIAELTRDYNTSEVFRTDEHESKSDYFLASAERIHFFAEPSGPLNKVGHGLHFDPVFGAYAQSPKIRRVVEFMEDPRLVQSMYIFKSAKVGGAVTSHQDATFLITNPPSVIGLWLAIDDATENNGCLWARPGSHKEPLRRRFMRGPEGLALDNDVDGFNPQTPQEAREKGFVPLPVKKGSLIVFNGTLDHLSLANKSPYDRHTFQLHVVEGPDAGVQWSSRNWLQQENPKKGFMRLSGKDEL